MELRAIMGSKSAMNIEGFVKIVVEKNQIYLETFKEERRFSLMEEYVIAVIFGGVGLFGVFLIPDIKINCCKDLIGIIFLSGYLSLSSYVFIMWLSEKLGLHKIEWRESPRANDKPILVKILLDGEYIEIPLDELKTRLKNKAGKVAAEAPTQEEAEAQVKEAEKIAERLRIKAEAAAEKERKNRTHAFSKGM